MMIAIVSEFQWMFIHPYATMFLSRISLFPLEILLQTIFKEYLHDSYCITVVSEIPMDFQFPVSFTYIVPNNTGDLTEQILQVSEKGCSDYIVKMKNPEKFMEVFEKVTHIGNARRSDRKLIFLPFLECDKNTELLDLLSLKETRFVANLLLVVPTAEENCVTYDLVTHKFIGQDEEVQKPYYLDKWNSCTMRFEQNANLFPHDMTNLYGKTVKVTCFNYKPYILLDLDTNVAALGRDGTEIKIVDEFCRWINCTIEMVVDNVHQWGEIYDNRTGVGVLGNIVEDRADLGITALYSWFEEYIYMDFSAATTRSAVSCIAPAPRLLASWETPLLPFSWYTWLALILTFLFSSVALTIAQGLSADRVFLTTFGMLVSQAQFEAGTKWRIRSVTGWLLVTGLVLDNAYGAGLAATFTVPKYEQSIDTIQDIVERRIEWGATHDAWIFSLTLSQEPLIKQLVRQYKTYDAEELKKRSFTRSMAFGIEKLPAGYFAIGEYITKEAMLDLMLMVEDFYYEQCVVMLRKSSPYTEKISQLIGRLHESGLMLAWETQVALKYLNYKVQLEVKLSRSKKEVEVEPLAIRHVMGIFYIYAAGVMMSGLLFFVELLGRRKIARKEIM